MKFWKFEIRKFKILNFENLKIWNFEILNFEILKGWNLIFWKFKNLKIWKIWNPLTLDQPPFPLKGGCYLCYASRGDAGGSLQIPHKASPCTWHPPWMSQVNLAPSRASSTRITAPACSKKRRSKPTLPEEWTIVHAVVGRVQHHRTWHIKGHPSTPSREFLRGVPWKLPGIPVGLIMEMFKLS